MLKNMLFVLVALATGCATLTRIDGEWTDPEHTGNGLQKIAVLTINDSPIKRFQFGSEVSKAFNAAGIAAKPGAMILPRELYDKDGDGRIDDDVDKKKVVKVLADAGYDGMLTVTVRNTSKEKVFIPGNEQTVKVTEFDSFHQYWVQTTKKVGQPGYYMETSTVHIETSLFSVNDTKLDWRGSSSTMSPTDNQDLAHSYAKKIVTTLVKEGLVRP